MDVHFPFPFSIFHIYICIYRLHTVQVQVQVQLGSDNSTKDGQCSDANAKVDGGRIHTVQRRAIRGRQVHRHQPVATARMVTNALSSLVVVAGERDSLARLGLGRRLGHHRLGGGIVLNSGEVRHALLKSMLFARWKCAVEASIEMRRRLLASGNT